MANLTIWAIFQHYRGQPTGLADYIGWLGNNFDSTISGATFEWIREFWKAR